MPEPQVSLFDARGTLVARVDGWLEDEALALEADGRAKYFLDEESMSADVDLAADELLDLARYLPAPDWLVQPGRRAG